MKKYNIYVKGFGWILLRLGVAQRVLKGREY